MEREHYIKRRNPLALKLTIADISLTDNFAHALISANVMGMLGCYYFFGLVERTKSGEVFDVWNCEINRLAGVDLSLFGITDEILLAQIPDLIVRRCNIIEEG